MVPPLGLLTASFGYSPSSTTSSDVTLSPASSPALSRIAVDLSVDASAIVTIGSSGTEILTYSATDFLNSLATAGTLSEPPSVPPPDTDTPYLLQQAANQAIVDAVASAPASAGIYNASGTLQNLPSSDLSTNWALVLQSNPRLASTVIANSLAQGITHTLIATA